MKTYKFELEVSEGHSEFWRNIKYDNGYEEVTEYIKEHLKELNPKLKLHTFIEVSN